LKDLVVESSCSRALAIESQSIILDSVSVTSNGLALALLYDGAELMLYKDTWINSTAGRAFVCKNANVKSMILNSSIGTLDIFGNVYVCGYNGNLKAGSIPDYVTITNGEVCAVDNDEFDRYVAGQFLISFAPNGGSVDQTSKVVYMGQPYGTLPTPERQNYTFKGWYTAAEGGPMGVKTLRSESITLVESNSPPSPASSTKKS
ncbi:MAG: InlB B-repeat-containing protein, partial [Helicobacter sp.]|nr:InlB B-repeat-containing protein [Helicobacter sp.]